MSKTVIKIESLSKVYRLGQVGTGTISHDLNRWWYKIRGKEDPYLKVGEINDRAHKGESDYVCALKDINLEVKKGEVIGIIGKNGAGKSTLLKILSKVTGPSTGSIKSKGRIASLLEVGTGFHPELTGRENIYMNGTIMGMTRKEIDTKLDEIVDFAGIERYIDTPTKRYSSGMTVRLGFAIAAHLEPEILVVDEVLAVGDAEFQKKAIGKMQEVSHEGGRTVLFVSHNMAAVRQLCDRGVVLENGEIVYVGTSENAVSEYLNKNNTEFESTFEVVFKDDLSKAVQFIKACLFDKNNNRKGIFEYIEAVIVDLVLSVNKQVSPYYIMIKINDAKGNILYTTCNDDTEKTSVNKVNNGSINFRIQLPECVLKPGSYTVDLTVRGYNENGPYHKIENALGFEIIDNHTYRGRQNRYRAVPLFAPHVQWEIV